MGAEHIKAGGLFLKGKPGTLAFESFPYRGSLALLSANDGDPDQAANATAIATGIKVEPGVLSRNIPGHKRKIPTLLEEMKKKGKAAGLITNSFVTDATLAAFAAHVDNQKNYKTIINDYLYAARPEVIFGASRFLKPKTAQEAGYRVLSSKKDFGTRVDGSPLTLGAFAKGPQLDPELYRVIQKTNQPSLKEMVWEALDILDNNPNGFFLVVENNLIDQAARGKNINSLSHELKALSNAVEAASIWAQGREETLIVVTSLYQSGDFELNQSKGTAGTPPVAMWKSKKISRKNVPVYAIGPRAKEVEKAKHLVDLYEVMKP